MRVRTPRPSSDTVAVVRPSAVRAVLVGVALAMTAAVVGAVASAEPAHESTSARRAQQVDGRHFSALTDLLTGSAGTTTPSSAAGNTTPAANPVGRPQPGNAPISMDAPIQGGLSAHEAQAAAARLIADHQSPASAGNPGYWTSDMARTAVERARSWIGMPYSWAGGNGSGPSLGRCEPGTGGDLDCHITGFDCSGLTLYAWAPYVGLSHFAQTQATEAGQFHPDLDQLEPGDLVFFAGYLTGGIGHVAIYDGDGKVIEAPQSGDVVKRSSLAQLVASDGYRGATRPMTTARPVLNTPATPVPAAGATVVLQGQHLAAVDELHLKTGDGGERTITSFGVHTDTTITFRARATKKAQTDALTASTAWISSKSVPLTRSAPKPTNTAPKSSTPPSRTTQAPPTSSGQPSSPTTPSSPPATRTSAPPTSPSKSSGTSSSRSSGTTTRSKSASSDSASPSPSPSVTQATTTSAGG